MGRHQLWPAAGPCHGVPASRCLGQRTGLRGSLGGAGLKASGQLKCRAHRGVNLCLLVQNFRVADKQWAVLPWVLVPGDSCGGSSLQCALSCRTGVCLIAAWELWVGCVWASPCCEKPSTAGFGSFLPTEFVLLLLDQKLPTPSSQCRCFYYSFMLRLQGKQGPICKVERLLNLL